MSDYTIRFTSGDETELLGSFPNYTEAAIHAEVLLANRGYDMDELVRGEWERDRLLIWENEADAANDAGAKALCSVERERTERDSLQDWAQEHAGEQLTRELADTAPCCEGWFLLVDEDGDLTGDLADAQDFERKYTACNDALGCVRLRTV
jgi:hypothetical protein